MERVNRTLAELLKGLGSSGSQWDVDMPRAVTAYNSTFHREIGACPSDFILKNAHSLSPSLHVDAEDVAVWKEGHPYIPLLE